MPLDGSGGYTLPPVYNVNGTLDILPEQIVQPFEDIQLALGLALYRDGRAAMTGDLQMGTKKITGLAAGVAATDAVTVGQAGTIAGSIANSSRFNRVINGAMRISQERGSALVDVTTASTYAIDQWQALLSTTPGGTLRCQQIASITPAGSPNRLRMTAQVADATIAVGDLYSMQQPIEGLTIADYRFGSAGAAQVLLRIGIRSSIAGTFGISIANSGLTRSWIGMVTIGAGEVNTDLLRTMTIPGDTTGSWLTDTGVGLRLRVCLSAGSDWFGVEGWQGSNEYTTSAQTNFMGTAGATFEIFDVGLYVDTAATSTVPPYEAERFDDELSRCRRYWEQLDFVVSSAAVDAGGVVFGVTNYTREKRALPVLALTVVGSTNATSIATVTIGNVPNTRAFGVSANGVSTGSPMNANGFVNASARF